MTFTQWLGLLWGRFSPLENRLIDAVRAILPAPAQLIFDAQVAAITKIQRHPRWTEIAYFRLRRRKPDWSGVPMFPSPEEFRLAEVRFKVGGRRYKATLTCIQGHIFDFASTPSPKAIAFADWDDAPSVKLLKDPMLAHIPPAPVPIPDSWRDFLRRTNASTFGAWTFCDAESAYSITLDSGEFLVLADYEGNESVLHRLEPPASTLFYLDSHDGVPEPIEGDIAQFLSKLKR